MTECPVVTCVIPTYRRPEFLRRAIRSVLKQTYPHFRLIIYDNASGDGTADVVREFSEHDERIGYHCHDTNIGAAANIAYAVSRVTTPLFSVLGDDDVLLPAFYESAVRALSAEPAAMFYCAGTVTDHWPMRLFTRHFTQWRGGVHPAAVESVERMIDAHFISTGVVWRLETQNTVGEFGSYLSDRSYAIVAAATHPFVVSEEEQAVFTVHPRSFTSGLATLDRAAHGPDFMLDIHRETVEGLKRTPLGTTAMKVLEGRLEQRTRRDLVAAVLVLGVRHARPEQIETLRRRGAEVKLHPIVPAMMKMLWAIRADRWMRAMSWMLGLLRKRKRKPSPTEQDRRLREYLDGLR
ncbi:MAG TPA: glycosyltransferase family 2 protein [Thermoanaerobaculia bacterium]|nr:glycosyltransferase family 2 protein [Thermoanaerobaculia bacterium]